MRLTLVLSLLLAAPGPEAYAAASKSLGGRAKAAPAAPLPGAAAGRSPLPAAAPSAIDAAGPAAPQSLMQSAAVPLPDFSAMGADASRGAAEDDFLRRMGLSSEIRLSASDPVGPDDADEPSRRRDQQDPLNSDDLGNVPRDHTRDDGPDSRDQGLEFRRHGLSLARRGDGTRMPEGPDESGEPSRPADPQDPGNSDPLGNPPRDPYRDDGPDSRDGGDSFQVAGRAKRSSGFMTPAMQLTLVAGGAIAFAAFGALGLPALAWASSAVAGASAVPLLGAVLADPSQASLLVPVAASLAASVGMGREKASAPLAPAAVHLVVRLKDGSSLTADQHVSAADVSTKRGRALYGRMLDSMYAQLAAAGLTKADLDARGAAPVAAYKRINAVTLRVSDAAKAEDLRAWLASQGHEVHENAAAPAAAQPEPVERQLEAAGVETVRALAQERFGPAEPGLIGRLALRLAGYSVPAVKQASLGGGVQAQLALAPWLRRSTTAYRAPATLDDALRSLTAAANDGHLVIADHSGLDGLAGQLRRQLAFEGHIVTATGRSGENGSVLFRRFGGDAVGVLPIAAPRERARVEPSAMAGAIALLAMMFGVSARGEKLDAVAGAAMGDDARRLGLLRLDIDAAYDRLARAMPPVKPNFVQRLALSAAAATDPGPRLSSLPREIAAEYAELLRRHESYRMRAADVSVGRQAYDDDVDPSLERDDALAVARMNEIEAAHPAAAKLRTLRGFFWLKLRGL